MAGLFDIFSNTNAQAAANAQIGGLQNAYNLAAPTLTSGYGQAGSQLNTEYANALAALASGQFQSGGALRQNIDTGVNTLNTAGSNAIGALTGGANTAAGALTSNYTGALQGYLQNYGQAQGGVNQLINALGFGGPAGTNSALNTLQQTPGYQFALNQGSQNVLRNAAQTGSLASGNTLNALQTQGQGLADQTYNNYVSQLQPFLGASATAAGGIGSTLTGLGTSLGNVYQTLGQNVGNVYTGTGLQAANLQSTLGQQLSNLFQNVSGQTSQAYQGLGGQLSNLNTGLAGNLANLGYNVQTGMGNAQANADLANNQASANQWSALMSGLGLASSAAGGAGGVGGFGNFLGSFGSAGGSGFASPSAITAGGGAPLAGSAAGAFPSFYGTTSDERLKENIEPVGELADGQTIYSYNFIGDRRPQIGLLAQEVEKVRPDAVAEIGGIKMVDYRRATEFASALTRFTDAANDDKRPAMSGRFTSELARFLEAA